MIRVKDKVGGLFARMLFNPKNRQTPKKRMAVF
jgi:hypothetical protein